MHSHALSWTYNNNDDDDDDDDDDDENDNNDDESEEIKGTNNWSDLANQIGSFINGTCIQ